MGGEQSRLNWKQIRWDLARHAKQSTFLHSFPATPPVEALMAMFRACELLEVGPCGGNDGSTMS